MKRKFYRISLLVCVAMSLGACGQSADRALSSGQDTMHVQAAATGISSGASVSTAAAACPPAQSGSSSAQKPSVDTPAASPLSPDAFAYAYEAYVAGPVGQGGLTAETVVVMTTDAHACDSGHLILHSGQPTLSCHARSFHARAFTDPVQLNTVSPAGNGECHMYGGDPENKAQVVGGFLVETPYGDGSDYTLDFSIKGVPATLQELPGPGAPNIITKFCAFPVEIDGLVPCIP